MVLFQLAAAHHHGVARAALLGLFGEFDSRLSGKLAAHQIATITDHDDDAVHPRLPHGINHVPDHRPAAHRHQHFGKLG